jgi:1-acyl-sn-glycerol-3-phosphate acyltransferase
VFVLWLIRWGFWWLARLILPLRYRIQCHVVSGEGLVASGKDTSATTHDSPLTTHRLGLGISDFGFRERPVLFLPNHPGYIDPIIMMTLLWPRFRARPLLWRGCFSIPFSIHFWG